MSTQLDAGAWRVGISDDVPTYVVTPQSEPILRTLVADNMIKVQPTKCVVEVLHRISGMQPHALLAGTLEPSAGDRLRLEVVRGAPLDLAGPAVRGPLGLTITVGLSPELAVSAAEGFVTSPVADPLPGGTVRIVGGAIDHDSSPAVFLRCGALLRAAIVASAASRHLEIKRLIETW
jgi:hypothetical protein